MANEGYHEPIDELTDRPADQLTNGLNVHLAG